MSARKKPGNFVQRLLKKIWRLFNALTKTFVNWILRSLLVLQRPSRLSQSGFVLPTVVMVMLVVALLTTAIVIRSFDRTKNASNYRVDEAVLNAASPAIDRARAKLERLFSPEETNLEGNTPDENNIAQVLGNDNQYTFGDETQVKLVYDFLLKRAKPGDPAIPGKDNQITEPEEKLTTAWKFPADTDNDGKFDSFTIYGIYFRNPLQPNDKRARSPLEARAIPQATGNPDGCTSSIAGSGKDGWYPTSGQLKKAFFTYVATVPITQPVTSAYNNIPATQFETYKGNKGFSALEIQQDVSRLALDNNAVWYEDDLAVNNVSGGFKLNGRIHTNGNLMIGTNINSSPIVFLQVSSKDSCFYDPVNAKIVVGGNVAANNLTGKDLSNDNVNIDLFKGRNQDPGLDHINEDNKTTTRDPADIAYNSGAYDKRLNVLVQGALNLHDQFAGGVGTEPTPTNASIQSLANLLPEPDNDEFLKTYRTKSENAEPGALRSILIQMVNTYFRERTRRVPFAEVRIDDPQDKAVEVGGTKLTGNQPPGTGEQFVFNGGKIVPPLSWMQIADAGGNPNGFTEVPLKTAGGNTMKLETTEEQGTDTTEYLVGDRIKVGNGLPTRWVDMSKPLNPPTYAEQGEGQPVVVNGNAVNWNAQGGGASGTQRKRYGLVEQLDDLGDTSRNGYWERAAAISKDLDNPQLSGLVGGMRVVTGAGIYIDDKPPLIGGTGRRKASGAAKPRSFLPEPPITKDQVIELNPELKKATLTDVRLKNNGPIVVWPDTMPMYQWDDKNGNGVRNADEELKGDLQMRATVVYHHALPAGNKGLAQAPFACISSYYDNSYIEDPAITTSYRTTNNNPLGLPGKGMSNNGLNYDASGLVARRISPKLRRQSWMVFPDGRWANKPLYDAIRKVDKGQELSLADYGAIDAANCALSILENPGTTTTSKIPDGAIKEVAFLDARQVKALHKPPTYPDGTTPLERETLRTDLANPEKQKIAELDSLQKDTNPLPQYSLPIEQRQPLEIRVTQIDLSQLTPLGLPTGNPGASVAASTGTGIDDNEEFLLPNSGIIYATRDDALPDISDADPQNTKNLGASATDFKLDPTRQPNGIMLINGESLARKNIQRTAEKGLILASNLPVYIKGDFNLHYQAGTKTTIEEFPTPQLLDFSSGAAPYGNFYTRTRPDNADFAHRKGAGVVNGDQWRAARILSDAVTLLSKNFKEGYRSDGDYDLRNNAGNIAVEARLKNGFWWNNYVTTADWITRAASANDVPNVSVPDKTSSYLTNAVTPVQRRANFPVYKMELCRKLPVSDCGPNDWTNLKPDGSTAYPAPALNTASNQTILPAANRLVRADKPYARRVAFERDPDTRQLILNDNADPTKSFAQPIGLEGTAREYKLGATVPAARDNALWFLTTSDNRNPKATPSYDKTKLLYYYEDTEDVSDRQLLLPGTPEFPKVAVGDPRLPGGLNIPSLNNPGISLSPTYKPDANNKEDPSDYAVCIPMKGFSKRYKVATINGTCPAATLAAIELTRQALAQQTLPTATIPEISALNPPIPANDVVGGGPPVLEAKAKVNIYDLPTDGILAKRTPGNPVSDLTITLKRGNQSDPIFVFRMPAGNPRPIRFGGIGAYSGGVTLELDGVVPNNIFWVSNTGMVFKNSASGKPHKLVGNFLGRQGGGNPSRLVIPGTPDFQINGGRFLGFGSTSVVAGLVNNLTAVTTTDQPLLIPILNLHSPTKNGQPSATPQGAFGGGNDHLNNSWLPRAAKTTFNGVFVMGDSPARPFPGGGGESGGGLHNFPRFLEAWEAEELSGGQVRDIETAIIKGSFIQAKKSGFATGPFETIDSDNAPTAEKDNSLFFDDVSPGVPDYLATYNTGTPSDQQYRYRGGAAGRKAPYYRAPAREWGYDVGLLSQTADLFARRFATPAAGTPNEYYREVGRDDEWVKTLMCAAQKQSGATGYEWAIADPKQRSASCPAATPGPEYN